MNQNSLPDGVNTTNSNSIGPSMAEWETFRHERRSGEGLPHLGTFQYHYQHPSPTRIRVVQVDDTDVHCQLEDGRQITVPLSWFPILRDATPEERTTFEVLPERDMVHFPLLCTEITTSQLLAYNDPLNESEHLLLCASNDCLLDDAAAIIAKSIRARGPENVNTVLQELERIVRNQRI